MTERVFMSTGTVAHLLGDGRSPNNSASPALCGRSPWPGAWYGTGSQNEHDKARSLPLCVGCATVLRKGP